MHVDAFDEQIAALLSYDSTAAIAGRHTIAATAIAPAIAVMASIPPIVRGDAMVVRTCS